MKLLIVAATWNEIRPLEAYLLQRDHQKAFSQHAVEILVTGPGSTLTAFHLGKMLPIDNWMSSSTWVFAEALTARCPSEQPCW
jgi:hypothetical protein